MLKKLAKEAAARPRGGGVQVAETVAAVLSLAPKGQAKAMFDLMAWNLRSRPGRPEGGEAMGLRAVFDYLKKRYGKQD